MRRFAKGENKEQIARPLIEAAERDGGDGRVVHDHAAAFDVAEADRSGGGAATSRPKGSSGWNAQHLLRVASDDAATPHERQSAYAKARHELDGLMVLPAITRAGIERRIAGEIEA